MSLTPSAQTETIWHPWPWTLQTFTWWHTKKKPTHPIGGWRRTPLWCPTTEDRDTSTEGSLPASSDFTGLGTHCTVLPLVPQKVFSPLSPLRKRQMIGCCSYTAPGSWTRQQWDVAMHCPKSLLLLTAMPFASSTGPHGSGAPAGQLHQQDWGLGIHWAAHSSQPSLSQLSVSKHP